MLAFHAGAEMATIIPIAIMQIACRKKNAKRIAANAFVCSTSKWIGQILATSIAIASSSRIGLVTRAASKATTIRVDWEILDTYN